MSDINVRDYGAVGDGVTNDSAAFNAAVAYLVSIGGGALRVPRGRYVGVSITVPIDGIRIVGEGRENTVLLPAADANCINFSFTGGKGWGVQDLSIKYANPSTSGNAIVAMSATSGEIDNLFIEYPFNGIQLGNCQATRISHCEIWFFINYGIYFNDNCNDPFIEHCLLNGAAYGTSTPGATSIGVMCNQKVHALMMDSVEIVQCNRPLQMEGSSANNVSKPAFSTFTDCFFDSSSNDVRLNYTRDIKFVGCWFSQRASGCTLQNTLTTKFIGCSFTNNDHHGCVVNATAKHTSFTDCVFDSNGQAAAWTYNGLTIAAGASDWSVIGGVYGNLGYFPVMQANGISIMPGMSGRCRIEGATFDNNAFSPVWDGGTGPEKYISRNIGYRTENGGTLAVSLSSGVGHIPHGLVKAPSIANAFVLNGGAAEATISSIDTTNIAVRVRDTTNDSNSSGAYMVVWSARVHP